MPADLIVYFLVAAGLIFWLRSILGTKHGDERDRGAPYLKPNADGSIEPAAPAEKSRLGPEERIAEFLHNPKGSASIDNKTAELGLLDIAKADRNFDIEHFAQAAQDAFVFIVESFAEGDRETLEDLLSPQVYAAFEGAISEREKQNETMHTEITAIKRADIIEAKQDGRTSKITVRFEAEEVSYTKDKDGEIVDGHPERISQMRDIWTFSRETKSRDPRWLLIETRADLEDDNDTVPNTVN